jgi:hypothetical protein
MNPLRVWADFNNVDGDRISTSIRPSLRRTPSLWMELDLIVEGAWVELYDGEGCSCFALIECVDEPMLECKLDWSTWRAATTVFEGAQVAQTPATPRVTGSIRLGA